MPVETLIFSTLLSVFDKMVCKRSGGSPRSQKNWWGMKSLPIKMCPSGASTFVFCSFCFLLLWLLAALV